MKKNDTEFSRTVLNSVIDYINNKSPKNIDMSELELISGYTRRHLGRLFSRFMGLTPTEYINKAQIYRILLELKFTTAPLDKICRKYKIRDAKNLEIKLQKIAGVNASTMKSKEELNFSNFIRTHKLSIPKKMLSCSFISLYDYDLQAKGIEYKIIRPISDILTSNYPFVESVLDDFCEAYSFDRNDVLACARFSAFDDDNYEFAITTCVLSGASDFPNSKPIYLQGDYLRFTWVGEPKDTFPEIKSLYDTLFLKYGIIRKKGHDILSIKNIDGVKNHYVYIYHIPIILNESISSVIEDFTNTQLHSCKI